MRTNFYHFAKRISSFLLIFSMVSAGFALHANAETYVTMPAEGYYVIKPAASNGYALDVTGGGNAAEKTSIQLYETNGTDAQVFYLECVDRNEGWYLIRHVRTGYVLNVVNGEGKNDGRIWLYHNDKTDACYFRFRSAGNGCFLIQAKVANGNYIVDLDCARCYNSSIVHLWSFHSGLSAQWRLEKAYPESRLPSLSSNNYIKTYTKQSSGRVYGYTDSTLRTQNSCWIDCQNDENRILSVKGAAVEISYPLDSGGRKTSWFKLSDFTRTDLNESMPYRTINFRVTTYKHSDGKVEYGYAEKGDKIYVLSIDWSTGYTQIIYPLSNGNWKMGWAKFGNTVKDPTSVQIHVDSNSTYYVSTSGANLTVRKNAQEGAEAIGSFSCGSRVTVYDINYNSEWAKVQYGEKIGYVHSAYLFQRVPSKVFSQSDPEWGDIYYGYASDQDEYFLIHATIGSGGCGLVSITNAIYYLNGKFADPRKLAEFSLNNDCRPNGGTNGKLAKVLCEKLGDKYGISWVRDYSYCENATKTLEQVKDDLKNGNVAVLHVEGHFVALVDYDSRTKKYLILDSCPATCRGTKITGYRWMSASDFVRDSNNDHDMGIRNDSTGYAIHVFGKK